MSEDDTAARARGPRLVRSARSWGGYAWFMSFGTFLPLPVFVAGYLAQLTFVGAPLARRAYRFGIFLSTLGQRPPGADKLESRHKDEEERKEPFAERVRAKAPPGWVERRREPFSFSARACWFVLVGWWLGGLWVLLAWSVLLLPYPFPELIRKLLADLPSVMTLAPAGRLAGQPGDAVAEEGHREQQEDHGGDQAQVTLEP
jgi:uncharacterized membrane protein YccF (DUF307 family)